MFFLPYFNTNYACSIVVLRLKTPNFRGFFYPQAPTWWVCSTPTLLLLSLICLRHILFCFTKNLCAQIFSVLPPVKLAKESLKNHEYLNFFFLERLQSVETVRSFTHLLVSIKPISNLTRIVHFYKCFKIW